MKGILEEGSKCPECGESMGFEPVENCSCHISPPCHRCVENPLVCLACGYQEELPPEPAPMVPVLTLTERIAEVYQWPKYKNEHDFGNGNRVLDCEYDGSSGSTMVWRGRIQGTVTPQQIMDFFGDGTFGHYPPSIQGDRFTYTLVTD